MLHVFAMNAQVLAGYMQHFARLCSFSCGSRAWVTGKVHQCNVVWGLEGRGRVEIFRDIIEGRAGACGGGEGGGGGAGGGEEWLTC